MAAFAGPASSRKLLSGGSFATARDLSFGAAGDFFSSLWQLVKTKAAEAAAYLATLLAALIRKADEVLPPETRWETLRRLLYVGVTVVLPAALVLYCLARYCCRCCCCCGRVRSRRGMMAAPGRGGARMPRDVFEGNPRGYFRDLRADKPLLY